MPWFFDEDGDGFGRSDLTRRRCRGWRGTDGGSWTLDNGDCDDGDPFVRPGVPDECDGYDNDCDGAIDEGC